jgi:hypothetical protein
MPQFTLKINLGNEAMQTGYHISNALFRISKDIIDMDIPGMKQQTIIRDLNGNSVGTFQVINTFVPNCKKFLNGEVK